MSANANTGPGHAGPSYQALPGPPGQPQGNYGGNEGNPRNNNSGQSGKGRGGKNKGKKNQAGGQPQQGSGQGQKPQKNAGGGPKGPPQQTPKNKGQPPARVFKRPEDAAALLAEIKQLMEREVGLLNLLVLTIP
jgi:hypothetical protein